LGSWRCSSAFDCAASIWVTCRPWIPPSIAGRLRPLPGARLGLGLTGTQLRPEMLTSTEPAFVVSLLRGLSPEQDAVTTPAPKRAPPSRQCITQSADHRLDLVRARGRHATTVHCEAHAPSRCGCTPCVPRARPSVR